MKKISKDTKRGVIKEIVKNELTREQIANQFSISLPTVYKIQRDNKDLYIRLVNDYKERITASALVKAQKCIEKINNEKITKSSGLQLTQMASNLVNINKSEQGNNISISITAPVKREDLIKDILEADIVSDRTIVNNGTKD